MRSYYDLIPGHNTASKQPKRFPDNYPKQIVKGKGAYIWDDKGNKYLDFMCSLGPIILGHNYPSVTEAVTRAIKEGTIFSLSHPLERALSELLCGIIPSAEMVRLATNGKDVTEAAVRLARHVTGREMILSFSYHGASDVFMACTKANKGVPKCLKKTIKDFDYNDEKALVKLFDTYEIAAVIMEPHTIRPPLPGYLKFVRDICNQHGTLLIFDEVVSFPRYIDFSAQSFFDVTPDLTCISKGMANGFPISALVGKEKYMKHFRDGGVFFSTTYGGNVVGCAAAIATLTEVIDKQVPTHIWDMGSLFRAEIQRDSRIKTIGYPCRQFFECSDEIRQKVWQEMIKEGVFLGVPIFFNYSMKPSDILMATKKLNKVIDNLVSIKLKGGKVKEVFKKR